MKTIKNQLLFAFILTFTIATNAQDRLMTLGVYSKSLIAENIAEYKDAPIIDNKTFTYEYKGGQVLVIFNGKEHIEYYNNNKNYIKSSIKWISRRECLITLKEINLPNFPFKTGTHLKMEITKIRGRNVYYKSTLGGRTWLGKMKEVDRDGESVIAAN
ncbi:hypothetical protein H9W90_07900 [Polaribacter pectinis]|uniref:Beta-lactamase-inhibitor-like PepSY-like domain-containing protein n=1 Tax=Polaribacter pectinis TaxID=2738844 RepID=A0A7G9LEH6_9FLAO|nr:hypothetical protein [Polaribacter pectinis]QNM87025.1 hypothetical protein H9W90_07900 [Polaribacter pectinis]